MFNRKIKYTLMTLTVLSLSACNQRTIVLQPRESTVHTQPETQQRTYRVERPIVQEEILIQNNPTLGRRVVVPHNNPSLGSIMVASSEEEVSEEAITPINAGKMERIEFPIDEYSHIKKIGHSTVKGSIYLENSHNSKKIMGAKVKLYLNPVTSYSKQWYEESYLGGYKMGKSDPKLFNYLKFTMSDESGRFNFFGIAPGSYYLVGTIKCADECGFSEERTVRLVEEISVGRGTSNVDLMKNVP